MDFLGVGPLELLFIILIALLVLGPSDLATVARRAGRLLNRMYTSEAWSTLTRASRDLRNLPNRLAREAALEELDESVRNATKPVSPGGPQELREDQEGEDDREANEEPEDHLAAWRPPGSETPDRVQDSADGEPEREEG